VHLKSKIVFTFQNANEEMQSVAFRVCGIYKTSNSMFDESTVFVKYDDIFPLTALPENAIHEVAINLPDLKTCDLVYPKIKAALPGLEVLSWKEINPTLSLSLGATEFFGAIIIGIFLLALSFGIVNTMLMAILERTKELGMLKAIGMSKNKIFRMIMLETVFLTLLGSVAGVILATIVLTPSLKTGIDLSFMMGDALEDYGFSAIVYPVINLKMFVEIAVLVVVAGILSAVYPARRALKIKTIEAIKTE
jgi:ABC-type lipoprotein release transport system permease subunit